MCPSAERQILKDCRTLEDHTTRDDDADDPRAQERGEEDEEEIGFVRVLGGNSELLGY